MKKLSLIACALLVLASCGDKSGSKKPAMKSMKDSFSYAFGSYCGGMMHRFKVKDIDWELFKASFDEAIKNGDSSMALDRETIGRVLNDYTMEMQFGENKKKGEDYIAKRKGDGFTATSSGILYKVLKPGTGPKPSITDTVLLHYTGTHVDGKIFDSNEGKEPYKTSLNGGSIKGFLEAISLMEEGSTIEVIIPWQLAYGKEGSRHPYTGEMSIEPYSTLTFKITLDSIQK